MNTIAQTQIDKIVDLYMENNSVLKTAKAAGISTVKARKILITEKHHQRRNWNTFTTGYDNRRDSRCPAYVCQKCTGIYAL